MLNHATLNTKPPIDFGSIPAVKYWLDAGSISGLADGATISATDWRDGSLSRRGALASATACVYRRDGGNGRPAVEFDGASSIAVSPSFAIAQPMRVFLVVQAMSYGATERRYIDGGATVNRGIIDQGFVSPYTNRIGRIYAGSAWACDDLATFVPWDSRLSSMATGPVGLYRLFDASFNGASSTLSMEFNTPKTGNPGSLGYPDGVTLGAATGGLAGFFCNCRIAELVICDASILPNDVALAIKLRLMRKHKLPASAMLLAAGSSLTAGLGVADDQNWVSQLGVLMSKPQQQFFVQNLGVNSQTTPEAIAYAVANYDAAFPNFFAQTFLFLDGGSWGNDIVLNNPGAAAAYNTYVSYFAGRQAAGFDKARCVAFTAGPRADISGGQAADRVSVNTSIRNNWRSFAGALVDIDADARLATPATDGVHYSATQYGHWAELAKRAVEPVLVA